MFECDVVIERRFPVACGEAEVFSLLADVPKSAKHFPTMERLDDLGSNSYRWNMAGIGIRQFSLKTVYACRYTPQPEKHLIRWVPIKGEGNALVKGEWRLKAVSPEETEVRLKSAVKVEVPFPGLMRALLAPVVDFEFNRLVDGYVANLTRALAAPKKGVAKKKTATRKAAAKR
jgi:ribosome-associated toxin RatA of RatAB toxin-antitoxin module